MAIALGFRSLDVRPDHRLGAIHRGELVAVRANLDVDVLDLLGRR